MFLDFFYIEINDVEVHVFSGHTRGTRVCTRLKAINKCSNVVVRVSKSVILSFHFNQKKAFFTA